MKKDQSERTITGVINFDEEIQRIKNIIFDFRKGHIKRNIAITAEPLAGKTTLINYIKDFLDDEAVKITLNAAVKDIKELDKVNGPEKIVILDDAQYLYIRAIGGYDILEHFLDMTTNNDKLFITSWNVFSWNYLDQIFRLNSYFPERVELPEFDDKDMEELLLARFRLNEVTLIEDVEIENKSLYWIHKYRFSTGPFRDLSIPVPEVNYRYFQLLLKPDQRAPTATKKTIFTKLSEVSNGNPGIAIVLWGKAVNVDTVRSSDIKDPSRDVSLDLSEAYVLSMILSMKSITYDDLSQANIGIKDLNEALYQLSVKGLIRSHNHTYRIVPEALKSIVKNLKSARQVW